MTRELPLTVVLTILALGVFTVGTDLFVLNGLLPTIAGDLHVSESTAGQLTTIFAVTYAIGSQRHFLASSECRAPSPRKLGNGAVFNVRSQARR